MKKIDWHAGFVSAMKLEFIEEPDMCNAVNELFADQIKEKELIIADMGTQIAAQNSQLADMDSQLAAKDALIAQLRNELEKYAHKN